MTKILGIIPARYGSSRFPGKPLIDIAGKTMIQRVYERASECEAISKVIVATDDERIFNVVEGFGGEVMMTSSDHLNGTERCAEVAAKRQADYYVNIQGDEPFVYAAQLDALCSILDGKTELGTLVKQINDPALLFKPTIMKVVLDHSDHAMYFSRQCIPFVRDHESTEWLKHHTFWKHIGVYAYRTDVLQKIVKLPPGELETAESLEQLRWLENGYRIKVAKTELESVAIDTPDDLERLKEKIRNGEIS